VGNPVVFLAGVVRYSGLGGTIYMPAGSAILGGSPQYSAIALASTPENFVDYDMMGSDDSGIDTMPFSFVTNGMKALGACGPSNTTT
jgi:hypothetical protein